MNVVAHREALSSDNQISFASRLLNRNVLPSLQSMCLCGVFFLLSFQNLEAITVDKTLLGTGEHGIVEKLQLSTAPSVEKQQRRAIALSRQTGKNRVLLRVGARQRVAHPVFVAMKTLKNKRMQDKFLRELQMHAYVTMCMQTLSETFCVPLLAIAFDAVKRDVALLMPAFCGITLQDEIDDARARRVKLTRLLALRWQTGDKVLEKLHTECGIVHGDAHLGNWYLEKPGGRMLLGDFGESVARGECKSRRHFLLLAGRERLNFRFEMTDDPAEKWRLGKLLADADRREQNMTSPALTC